MVSARMYVMSLTDDADEIDTLASAAETDIQNTLIEANDASESKQLADGYVADIEELATQAIDADDTKAQDAATQAELYRDEAELNLIAVQNNFVQIGQLASAIIDLESDARGFETAAQGLANHA